MTVRRKKRRRGEMRACDGGETAAVHGDVRGATSIKMALAAVTAALGRQH